MLQIIQKHAQNRIQIKRMGQRQIGGPQDLGFFEALLCFGKQAGILDGDGCPSCEAQPKIQVGLCEGSSLKLVAPDTEHTDDHLANH